MKESGADWRAESHEAKELRRKIRLVEKGEKVEQAGQGPGGKGKTV